MQVWAFQGPRVWAAWSHHSKKKILPISGFDDSVPCSSFVPKSVSSSSSASLQCSTTCKFDLQRRNIRVCSLNVGTGSDGYEDRQETNNQNSTLGGQNSDQNVSADQIPHLASAVLVLSACAVVFLLNVFTNGPSSLLPALAKSGLTAAFSLIFVSEIGDKTFFIAALLAMQYDKLLGIWSVLFISVFCCVLLGSMAALSLMTILSVVIGLIFHSVPSQFQTTLPIGEYAAITLLMFFGLKSIKDAWELPAAAAKTGEQAGQESDEFVEAEELVKEKVSNKLSNPLEVLWKSFSVVFFAEWGDRSMLATIALGAAQSPWGVASGAIAGHLLATFIAILGGAFLAKYISEKMVGYIGGALFLVFGIATLFGVF